MRSPLDETLDKVNIARKEQPNPDPNQDAVSFLTVIDKKIKHGSIIDPEPGGSSNKFNMQCNILAAELDGSSKY